MDTDPSADPPFAAILERLDRIDRRLDAMGAPEPTGTAAEAEGPMLRQRRFRLLDMMILVASLALVLPAYRVLPEKVSTTIDLEDSEGLDRYRILILVTWAFVTPIALAATLAILAIRLLPPRPNLRVLSGQAGTIGAGVAAALTVSHYPLRILMIVDGDFDEADLLFGLGLSIPKTIGSGVFGAWLALLAAGRLRRPADWVDGLGWIICIYWMIAGALNYPFYW